jgi:FKBP-type peptidyl-prolyl cis-trans isomerase SlyD
MTRATPSTAPKAAKPLPYLHGANNIVPGLEKALTDQEAGAKLDVTVPCEDGYGPVHPEAIATLPHEAFQGVEDIQPGMQFQAQGPEGQVQVILVKEVTDEGVVVDGNHPLAGQTLHFSIEVGEVREATAEEIEQGHPHMPGHECCGGEKHAEGGCDRHPEW